jgi:hypothetical protein
MRAVLALLVFTAFVVRVQAEELPPVDGAIEKELPIPSNVFVPPPPPKEVPPMRVDIPPPPEPKPFVPAHYTLWHHSLKAKFDLATGKWIDDGSSAGLGNIAP